MDIFEKEINTPKVPESVAIIMDGNGRWAKKRGLPRSAGHAEGAKNVMNVLSALREIGVHHLTLYAFSTENWKRPDDEVAALMDIFAQYAVKIIERTKTDEEQFTVKFLGDKSRLPDSVREKCIEAERLTEGNSFVCNIALNYGGRYEIVHAANAAIADGYTTLTEEILSRYMYTAHSPDPDLVIRTGGDFRISNFLLWQSAYSEFLITDTLWPDFGREEVIKCISEFNSRNRRFGGLDPEDSESEANPKQNEAEN